MSSRTPLSVRARAEPSTLAVVARRRFDRLSAPQVGAGRPLRILHVAEAFGGGVLEVTRHQSEAAARAGHRVAIAYGRRPETPDDVRSIIDPAVELYETAWTERTVSAQLRVAKYLRALARDWQPDIVHLQSSFAGVLGVAMLRRHGARLVYTPHGFASDMSSSRFYRGAVRVVERAVATRVALVGAISASEGEQARRAIKAPRVRVIENGIPELDPGNLPPAAPLLGKGSVRAVGRLRPQRRPEACSRILSALVDIADVAWIGGGDPSGPEAQSLAEAGIPVTGWLPRERTLEALGQAEVYLHWTAWDGLPLTVLEAMARDVVVVASDIPANRELLGPEQVFESEADAIDAIRSILTDRERRMRCLENQRVRRRYYSAERMNVDWLSTYEQLVSAGPTP